MSKASASRKLLLAAALSAGWCSAHAQDAEHQARTGAVTDGVSMAVGFAAGVADVNPVVPVLMLGMKAVTFEYTSRLPETERPAAYATAAAVWQGTAVNNVCMTAAVLTGGAFLPACVAAGVAWGMKTWNDSERERRFWEHCAIVREFAQQPDFACVYQPADTELAGSVDAPVLAAQDLVAP
jgi:hypothetical protein